MPKLQHKQQKLAVLIDAENVSHTLIRSILLRAACYGVLTIKRAYADWTRPQMSNFKPVLLNNAIEAVQLFPYAKGKNAADIMLSVEAMSLVNTGQFDGVCLVSSDSDLTPLAFGMRREADAARVRGGVQQLHLHGVDRGGGVDTESADNGPMQFQPILEEIVATLRPQLGEQGRVADYIPALARVPAAQFGIALRTCDGDEAQAGDSATPFSIQSISKLFALTMGMRAMGERLWERIGREPSGNPFNSLVQLEAEQGTPRNPFINAGAIAVTDRLVSQCDPKAAMLELVSSLCNEPVHFDEEVAASEAETGYRNMALGNFMKSFGKIDNSVATVLDAYFHHCAVRMSCLQLARATGYLCRDGRHPFSGEPLLTERQTRRINALMLTCGTYDAAGEFAFRIGLPCKSGVGGGIVAVVPDRLSLCVWSPALDATGNSLLGMQALELFAARTGLSVF